VQPPPSYTTTTTTTTASSVWGRHSPRDSVAETVERVAVAAAAAGPATPALAARGGTIRSPASTIPYLFNQLKKIPESAFDAEELMRLAFPASPKDARESLDWTKVAPAEVLRLRRLAWEDASKELREAQVLREKYMASVPSTPLVAPAFAAERVSSPVAVPEALAVAAAEMAAEVAAAQDDDAAAVGDNHETAALTPSGSPGDAGAGASAAAAGVDRLPSDTGAENQNAVEARARNSAESPSAPASEEVVVIEAGVAAANEADATAEAASTIALDAGHAAALLSDADSTEIFDAAPVESEKGARLPTPVAALPDELD
jgi:hypothetical protein